MKIQLTGVVLAVLSISLFAVAQETAPIPALGTITGSGTLHYVPVFTGKATIGNSKIFQATTGNVGIGTTSPQATLDVDGEVNASTSFNLGGTAFAFGSLANVNIFLGFAGNSTMSGKNNMAIGPYAMSINTTGNGDTAIGPYALNANTTGYGDTAVGYGALQSNTTAYGDTALGYAALQSNTTGYDNTASGDGALEFNTTGNGNTAYGNRSLELNISGGNNSASGWQALFYNTTGDYNTAEGYDALNSNTTGNSNTGDGTYALFNNTTGSYNTALGYLAGPDSASTGLSYATAIGAGAVVSRSNALVLGGPLGSGANVNVGIGTATPSNVFTIAQTAGQAISDGWTTYSSRRWKTNIETLRGALAKVEQLRGVSYEQKDSGKHEVGLIAEEVGAVVPEVVSYEENGKDARGVDYSRLTALLIEATKEQQGEFRQQQAELAKALHQIKQQQSVLRAQAASMRSLEAEVRQTRETLRKVQVAAAQPALVAQK